MCFIRPLPPGYHPTLLKAGLHPPDGDNDTAAARAQPTVGDTSATDAAGTLTAVRPPGVSRAGIGRGLRGVLTADLRGRPWGVRLRLVMELAGPGRDAVERLVERVPVAALCVACVPGRFLRRSCR